MRLRKLLPSVLESFKSSHQLQNSVTVQAEQTLPGCSRGFAFKQPFEQHVFPVKAPLKTPTPKPETASAATSEAASEATSSATAAPFTATDQKSAAQSGRALLYRGPT